MPTPKEPRNPGGSIVRLSIIVYGSVLAFTALAVIAWYWYKPPEEIPGMIYIPAGTFLAGADKQPVKLKGFYIDSTEVTNADYSDFCGVKGCPIPSGVPNLPVVNISMDLARAFAHWKNKRLPTGLEWERAARGVDGARFPWGDSEDPKLANVSNNPSLTQHALMPVRSFASYPEFQMVGNAWEMVEGQAKPQEDVSKFAARLAPPITEDEPWILIRGGSYLEPLMPVYDSRVVPARYEAGDIGFRCAKDR
jgi:formylglycine-generating enzyme required for sulfatase activity